MKWVVLAVWLAAFCACWGSSGRLAQARHDDVLSYLPRDAQSTQAYRLARLWGDADLVPAVVVYARTGGLTAADRRLVAAAATRDGAMGDPGAGPAAVAGPGDPVQVSADGAAAQYAVPFDAEDPKLAARVETLRDRVAAGLPAGLTARVGGPAGQAADSYGLFDKLDGPLLYLALGVVMVLLLLTYRSPVLWIVPLVAAFAGLTLAQEAAVLLARHADLTVNGLSQSIMLVLTVGAGVDYALLLVSRYREELTRHRDKHEAMAVALRNAGPAIVASAGTVAVSLLCLLFSVLNSDRGLGPVAALGVLGAFAAMVSLLPALLLALPRQTFWPRVPHYAESTDAAAADREPRGWGVVACAVARRPRRTWIAATLLLAAMATGLSGLRSSGLSTADSFPGRPDSIRAQDLLAAHFPQEPGGLGVVIGAAGDAERIAEVVAGDPGVRVAGGGTDSGAVDSGAAAEGGGGRPPGDAAPEVGNLPLAGAASGYGGPASAGAGLAGAPAAGRLLVVPRVLAGHARFDVALVDTPDSPAAQDTVRRLRAALGALPHPAAPILVGGPAAVNLDVADASRHDRDLVIPAVLGVVLLVLGLLLRSVPAPLLLIGTVVLSFAAALGASHLVFRYGFGFHGTDVSYPLFSFVFLVALGIDYNIFLMTRVLEESRRHGTRAGTIRGVTVTGGVITSAGVVLAATFGVLATLPLVALIEIGFTVAFGVLLDTLLVRTLLVPALTVDVGDRIWWPGKVGGN